jgi:hypothetical protein
MNNVIERIKYKINKSEVPKLEDILNQTFREIDKIYGYFVSVSFDNNEHTGFVIHYSICMNDYYNTVLSERAISKILKSIRSYTDNP